LKAVKVVCIIAGLFLILLSLYVLSGLASSPTFFAETYGLIIILIIILILGIVLIAIAFGK
jgi:hypothetical protein